jgi:hypothetical protein
VLVEHRREAGTRGEEAVTLERWIRLIAGTFILISLALSQLHSVYWLYFTAFVGLNLFQSALTRWCLMEDFLRKLGVSEGHTE